MIRHKRETFTRGDAWRIAGTLYDHDGNPMVLPDGCIIEWAMMDATRTNVITASNVDGSITIADATEGAINVIIPADKTDITPGSYSDALRLTIGGQPETMWTGAITVEDSPFVGRSST